MRRLFLVATALTAMATVGTAVALVPAAGARTPSSQAHAHARPSGKPITVGSTWTLYDQDYSIGITSCSALTFSDGSAFADSDGGVGHWNAQGKLMWGSSGYLANKSIYKGKYVSSLDEFVGTVTAVGSTWGVFRLVKGDDPLLHGGCSSAPS